MGTNILGTPSPTMKCKSRNVSFTNENEFYSHLISNHVDADILLGCGKSIRDIKCKVPDRVWEECTTALRSGLYKCWPCQMRLNNNDMNEHLKKKHLDFLCKWCKDDSVLFGSIRSIVDHIAETHPANNLCPLCGGLFRNPVFVMKHISSGQCKVVRGSFAL